MKDARIKIGEKRYDIPTAAKMLCLDMGLVEKIDTASEHYSAVLRHMLSVTVPEITAISPSAFVWGPTTPSLSIVTSHESITIENRKEPYISLFFKSLPPDIMAMREELIAFCAAAIAYIDTTTPPDGEDGAEWNWFDYSLERQAYSVVYMPEAEQTRERRLKAINTDPEVLLELDSPTLEEQLAAAGFIEIEDLLKKFGPEMDPRIIAESIHSQICLDTATLESKVDELPAINTLYFTAITQQQENDEDSLIEVSEEHEQYTKKGTNKITLQHPLISMFFLNRHHDLRQERMEAVAAACADATFREIDIPRAMSTRFHDRFVFDNNLLTYEVASTHKKTDHIQACIASMKQLSVLVDNEADTYAFVDMTDSPAPGKLGESGITGLEVYAYYYHKKFPKVGSAAKLADVLAYGFEGYEYPFLLQSRFLSLANITDIISFNANVPAGKAEAIYNHVANEMENVELFYDIGGGDAMRFAAIYTKPEEYPREFYDHYNCTEPGEYYLEYIIKPPAANHYTHVICKCTDHTYLKKALHVKPETEDCKCDPCKWLVSRAVLMSYVYVSYRIYGMPTICSANKTHRNPIKSILNRAKKADVNAYTLFLFDIEKYNTIYTALNMDVMAIDAFIDSSIFLADNRENNIHIWIGALCLIAFHATGICGRTDAELDQLCNWILQFWNTCMITEFS